MLCVLILYIIGGTYSLKSTPNDRFFEKLFMAILFTHSVFARNLLTGNRQRNTFRILFWYLAWDSILLDYGDFIFRMKGLKVYLSCSPKKSLMVSNRMIWVANWYCHEKKLRGQEIVYCNKAIFARVVWNVASSCWNYLPSKSYSSIVDQKIELTVTVVPSSFSKKKGLITPSK